MPTSTESSEEQDRAASRRSLATIGGILALLIALVVAVSVVSKTDPKTDIQGAAPKSDEPGRLRHVEDVPLVDAGASRDVIARTIVATPIGRTEPAESPIPTVARIEHSDVREGIRGRVVGSNASASIAGARVTFQLKNRGEECRSAVESDADGRFIVPLHSRPAEYVHLTFASTGAGRRVLELNDVPAEGLDLGDVELSRTFDLHFVVRDLQGQPVRGAVARTGDGSYAESEPTNRDGRGVLRDLLPSTDELWLLALGYEARWITVPRTAPDEHSPLEIRLTRRLLLTIRVRRIDGTPAKRMVVVLSTTQPEPLFPDFAGDPPGRELSDDGFGASCANSVRRSPPSQDQPTLCATYRSDENGRVVVDGWRPMGSLNVRVEGQAGDAIIERDFDLAVLGQRETIDLVVQAESRTLELRITDEQGAPTNGAEVFVGAALNPVVSTLMDGIARIDPLYRSTIDVRVQKDGMCTTFLDGLVLEVPVVRRDVVLGPGYSVRVHTLDSAGREVTPDGVDVRWNGKQIRFPSIRRTATYFTAFGLAGESVEIAAHVGGRVFRMNHDARRPDAQLLLPPSGRVRVEFSPPLDPISWQVVQLVAVDEPDVVLQTRVEPHSSTGFVEFPTVFPGHYSAELRDTDVAGTVLSASAHASSVVVQPNEMTVVQIGN